ncbi:Peptidoglycan D,D-transpeptidase MrdA [Streptomyces hirsutus]
MPFSVKATVSYDGKSEPLAYKSELTVVRGQTTGRALVDWEPSVVHPELKEGDTLVTGETAQPPIEAVGRDGTVLTEEEYPSLGPILDTLREKYGGKAGGTPGIELTIRHAEGSAGGAGAADSTLVTLAKGKPGKLRTTLSAGVQAAAEKAVKEFAESSVVAVQPSTGEVLAVANHREDGFDAAFQGRVAPGSTMKIITAAMLIDNGVVSMNGPAPCPPTATWQSQTFKNLTGMEPNEGATLANSFLRSCNTAFIKLIDEEPLTDASLTQEAQERFGLGRDDWATGVVSFDGSVPAVSGPDRAANAIGQGQVQMNPLNMASVTATAITGTFRQPYLVSPELDGRQSGAGEGSAGGHREPGEADDAPDGHPGHRGTGHVRSRRRHRREDRLRRGRRQRHFRQLVHRLPGRRRGGGHDPAGRPRRRRGRSDCRSCATSGRLTATRGRRDSRLGPSLAWAHRRPSARYDHMTA